ncbi:solute carrier family 41 member 3 isoform 11-T12 [Molossus nigricans]
MDGTETRQRRPEELGLPHTLSTGGLPAASEDRPLSIPESQWMATKPLGTELNRETALSIGFQVTVPFMFAGLGLSGAGILLNYFQHWAVFVEVKDLLTLVPSLVGLKGNLEMTLASRLATAISKFLQPSTPCPVIYLWAPAGTFTQRKMAPVWVLQANTGQIDDPREQHRVINSNLALIQVQATVLGLLAAVVALLLGAVSRGELDFAKVELLCASSVITAFLASFALGVGGNLVAIQTSRISTYLHMWSTPGVLPLWMKKFWPNPCSTFCTSEINSMSARVLLCLVIPSHLIFFSVIYLVEGHSVPNGKTFVVFYLLAGLIQVTILLYLAEVMVRLIWHQALDPDNHCIPYLTGLGDLLGTGLLALCFLISWLLREAELDGISEPASGPPY